MFLGGMFRGAASQTTGAQQRAAEDYVSVIIVYAVSLESQIFDIILLVEF